MTSARVLHFATPAVADDTLLVTALRGHEALSRCFRFEIDLVVAKGGPALDPAQLVAAPASLRIDHRAKGGGQGRAAIRGMLAEFACTAEGGDWTKYRAVLVPRLWTLGLGTRSRVFLGQSVPDVVAQVLKDAGVPGDEVEFRCAGSYPARDYIVQYQESDLAFITRLMSHEGIFFWSEHGAETTKLVIADQQQAFVAIAGDDALEYQPQAEGAAAAGDWFREERIRSFALERRVVPGEVVVKDWNWRKPGQELAATATVADRGVGDGTYEWGPHYQEKAQGARLADLRAQELRCRQQQVHGDGDGRCFRAGSLFTLRRHFRGAADGEYLIVAVEHEASQGIERGSGTAAVRSYRNRFTALPAAVPYRPEPVATKPVIPGVLNARIDASGSGQYAELDQDGCYRVRLPFERADHPGGKASRAVRMAQPYTGADHGIHFPLHKDAEVLLAHVNGDPDRPIIAGAVPNPDTPSPVTDGNPSQSVIRTAGRNELRIEDLEGAEKVHLTATRDHAVTVGNDQVVTVGSDATTRVGGNEAITIAGAKSEVITLASEERVGAAKSVAIGAAFQITVGAAMNETVGGAKAEEVGGYKYETVAGERKLTVGKDFAVTVGQNHREEAEKNRSIKAAKISIEAEQELQIVVGKARITMKKNGDIAIEGANITVKGSGNVVVKGQKIAEN